MKKFFFIAAAAAALMCSCNKEEQPVVNNVDKSEPATITLNLAGSPATKATGDVIADTDDEAKVNSIQIFVFNGDVVDAYKKADASEVTAKQVVLQGTVGTRMIYAFVNAPDLSSYTSKTALLASVTSLADNAANSYVMSGKTAELTVSADFETTINVDRYVSRIRIHKITRKMASDGALKTATFKVNRIYLTSAVTNETYGFGKPAAYTWTNVSFGTGSRALATDNAFVYQSVAGENIADGSSLTQTFSFYALPNTNASDDNAAQSAQTYRRTRLVVECIVNRGNGNEYFTYPVAMPAMESNKSYELNELVITILGNPSDGDDDADDGEDQDIDKINETVKIVVNDWTEVLVGNDQGVFTI